uniref:25S rRNA (uridine-N(3))-methyltransferase BMT5-like domain-containing protein n=1 Tax=Alexandrium monilatum TaxID=311494 RepID=A0A7S4VZ85_9DINO|mmetsp:Transcript_53249/g.158765  ORF Transcript_53249/g.158765 Transcript_53249/m.158765 type:complete len:538 (-) Transcript_53249:183-1796(-)
MTEIEEPTEDQVAEEPDALEQALAETAAEGEEAAEEEPAEEEPAEDDEAAAEPAAEEPEDSDEEEMDADGVTVSKHLKDSVEGSLRLKRLLSRDDDDAPDPKKRKVVDPEAAQKEIKIRGLLAKWQMVNDAVCKHVLRGLSLEEVIEVEKSNYVPDKFHMQKSPPELLGRFVGDLKERKMVGGSPLDSVGAFKYYHKLDLESEKKLRALKHKDLRYVLTEYDGSRPLDEVIADAAKFEPEEQCTATAIPEYPGPSTVGRFNRLELIDPLADCAVFGDANLTFAVKLAKHRKALGHVGRVIATTFEEVETLRERYKEIDESIKVLEDHYAEVYHGVDCTRIAIDPRFEGMEDSLGAVYYNFPHSGAIQGFFDGHPVVNWRHENLMRLFFRALRSFVKPGGSVKVSSNMGAVGVRYSYIVGSALDNEFVHVETMPFLEWHLHRYGRSYGDKRDVYKRPDAKNNQSYNAQAADRDMVYCFIYKPSGETLPPQQVRLPPTLKTLTLTVDGPFKHLGEAAKKNLAMQLHKRFVTEVSGTHVG